MKQYVLAALALSFSLTAVSYALDSEPEKLQGSATQTLTQSSSDAKTTLTSDGFTASDKYYSWFRPTHQWTKGAYGGARPYNSLHPYSQRPVEYNIGSNKNFADKNYALANFTRYELSNANFRNTILTEAKFNNSHLNGADFSGASLMYSNFAQANLVGVNFAGADLTNVNFYGANMNGAKYDKYTILPHGFVPEKVGMVYLP